MTIKFPKDVRIDVTVITTFCILTLPYRSEKNVHLLLNTISLNFPSVILLVLRFFSFSKNLVTLHWFLVALALFVQVETNSFASTSIGKISLNVNISEEYLYLSKVNMHFEFPLNVQTTNFAVGCFFLLCFNGLECTGRFLGLKRVSQAICKIIARKL